MCWSGRRGSTSEAGSTRLDSTRLDSTQSNKPTDRRALNKRPEEQRRGCITTTTTTITTPTPVIIITTTINVFLCFYFILSAGARGKRAMDGRTDGGVYGKSFGIYNNIIISVACMHHEENAAAAFSIACLTGKASCLATTELYRGVREDSLSQVRQTDRQTFFFCLLRVDAMQRDQTFTCLCFFTLGGT